MASGTTVVALDPATAAVQGAIPVGGTATRVAASTDGARVFVSMSASGAVAIVDTATQQVVHAVPVGASASGLAVAPDGATLYVSAAGGAVHVVDVATGSVSATIASGVGDAADLAVTSDGATLYAASGSVAAIDTATRVVTAVFGVGATSVEVTPDGATVFVVATTDLFGGGLFAYDTSDSYDLVASLGLGMPGPMAMAPDGSRVYVSHSASWVDTGYGAGFFPGRSVFVIDGLTKTLVGQIDLGASGANWSQQNTPGHLAVSHDRRRLYISVPNLAAVAVADVNTHAVTSTTPVSSPGAVAVTGAGPVAPYVVNAVDDTATCASTGGIAVANVLANDTFNGATATLAAVTLTQVSTTASTIALVPTSGGVFVSVGTPAGAHSLTYRICERTDATNCAQGTATIELSGR